MFLGLVFGLLGFGVGANAVAAALLRWVVAKPMRRDPPTRCPCGYPRTGLPPAAVCPECGGPAPSWTARSLTAPPSHAGLLAAGSLVCIMAVYTIAIIVLGTSFGVLDAGEAIFVSLFVAPAAMLAGLQVLLPNIGERRLSFRQTGSLAVGVTGGTLGVALAYAWFDVSAAAASTTSEWRGIGLLLVTVPTSIGTGLGALAACVWLMIVDAGSRRGTARRQSGATGPGR